MTDPDGTSPRRHGKSEAAFRTIREVSEALDVPQHVLRFWESRFPQVRPLKRGGGRRYYRPEDVALLQRIRDHLYRDGYTIKGVQKLLRERAEAGQSAPNASGADAGAGDGQLSLQMTGEVPMSVSVTEEIRAVLNELGELRALLVKAATDRCQRRGGGL